MPKKFLTVKEVSRLFGVTPLTIRNWDKRGKLTAYRHPVNNYRLYKTEDVEEIMKGIESSRSPVATSARQALPPLPVAEIEEEEPRGPRKLEVDIL